MCWTFLCCVCIESSHMHVGIPLSPSLALRASPLLPLPSPTLFLLLFSIFFYFSRSHCGTGTRALPWSLCTVLGAHVPCLCGACLCAGAKWGGFKPHRRPFFPFHPLSLPSNAAILILQLLSSLL